MIDIRINEHISLKDVVDGKIHPINAYQIIVNTWIIKPAKTLAATNDKYQGMALLIILLAFFEPHGQFLSGITERGNSENNFTLAFSDFIKYLNNSRSAPKETTNILPRLFYKWARCGLFHSGKMSKELLIEGIEHPDSCIYKTNNTPEWFVNPWVLVRDIEDYCNDYAIQLMEGKDETMLENFYKTFDKLVMSHAKHFYTNEHSA